MKNNSKFEQACQQRHERKKRKSFLYREYTRNVAACKIVLERLTRSSRRAANFLIEISQKHEGHKWSRAVIAKRYKISETTVKRIIKKLKDMGLIISIGRFKSPNSFLVGPNCFNGYIRQSLMFILPALGLLLNTIHVSSLLSKPVDDPHIYLYESTKKQKENSIRKRDRFYENNWQQNRRYELQQHLDTVFPEPNLFSNPISIPCSIKKESIMLKSLELTDAGRINLSPFPDSAITFADEQLTIALAKGPLRDPFAYICKQASDWCKERNVRPSWKDMYDQYDRAGITHDTPRYSKVLVAVATKRTKKTFSKSDDVETNPVPLIDKLYACCYWKTLDRDERFDYLHKQLGLRPTLIRHYDENECPLPLSQHYRDKLTCNHG